MTAKRERCFELRQNEKNKNEFTYVAQFLFFNQTAM